MKRTELGRGGSVLKNWLVTGKERVSWRGRGVRGKRDSEKSQGVGSELT